MSTTAGVFSETLLRNVRLRADQLMLDDRIRQQYIPQTQVIDGILAAQTANIRQFQGKDKDVEIMWMNACGLTVGSDTPCVMGGPKTSTNLDTYSLAYNKSVPFTVSESDFINNEFDFVEGVAKAMLAAEKLLVEDFAQYCVGRLNAFKGVNDVDTGKGVVSGSDTYVAANFWDASLFAYLSRVSVGNKFTSPILISGQNLYEQYMTANFNAGNANGVGSANLFNSMKIYFDLFNVDSVNTPDLITYMVSQGSLAIANKWYNPMTPEQTQVFTRFAVPSQFIPGFYLDVWYEQACDGNNFVKHNYKMNLKGDLFNNPAGCDATNTGVLTFLCGTPSLQ